MAAVEEVVRRGGDHADDRARAHGERRAEDELASIGQRGGVRVGVSRGRCVRPDDVEEPRATSRGDHREPCEPIPAPSGRQIRAVLGDRLRVARVPPDESSVLPRRPDLDGGCHHHRQATQARVELEGDDGLVPALLHPAGQHLGPRVREMHRVRSTNPRRPPCYDPMSGTSSEPSCLEGCFFERRSRVNKHSRRAQAAQRPGEP